MTDVVEKCAISPRQHQCDACGAVLCTKKTVLYYGVIPAKILCLPCAAAIRAAKSREAA